MFNKKRQRKITLSKRPMRALNCLRFFLENEECAQGLGEELAEVDIYINPAADHLMTITFFTDKDFKEAVTQGLCRPIDTKRKTAVVEFGVGYVKIELYDYPRPIMSKLICHRRVGKDFMRDGEGYSFLN